ncbi:DUF2490 domain-containing protein [Novosphingobium sp.]|uniref:DUF2490 domain-containing protein n=1 Tax=Novosphingobium sp. TaxID=1874826 RepID=UPI0035AE6E63
MHRNTARLLTTLAALAALPAQAAEDTAYWQNLNLNVKLSDDLRISSETSFRTSDARGFYQIQQVVLLGYKPSKKVTVAAGFVHTPQYSQGKFTVMERRLRQQVSVDDITKLGPLKVGARLRTEQRWREGISATAWRLRPSLRASAPLAGPVSLNLNHESFINLNTTSFQRQEGYDRMRNTVAVSLPLNKQFGLELGYINQRNIVRGGADNIDHVLSTSFNASF